MSLFLCQIFIFTKERLNVSRTEVGLYVVKMVIEGNHGQVWIESEGDGMGSRFIIELPVG